MFQMRVSPPIRFQDYDFLCEACFDKIDKQQKERHQSSHQFKNQMNEILRKKNEYEKHWDKDGIVQFKNERIAILLRMLLKQVEFIIAFDDLVAEGYELVGIDESREPNPHGGWDIGGESYFYFQKNVD